MRYIQFVNIPFVVAGVSGVIMTMSLILMVSSATELIRYGVFFSEPGLVPLF